MPHEGTKATAPTQHTTEPSETSTSQCLPNLNLRKVLDQPSPQALVERDRESQRSRTREDGRARKASIIRNPRKAEGKRKSWHGVERRQRRDAKKKIEELNMEVVEMRDETRNTKNDLEEARERAQGTF